MTCDPSPLKHALRQAAFAARKTAHAVVDPAPALAHLLAEVAAFGPGTMVSGYCAIRTELEPAPALVALSARGHGLCLPVVPGRDVPLIFRAWTPDTPLVEGAFGARTPPGEAPVVTPTVLIVPLLAFDATCQRLGYGGGYYDRTLALLRAAGPVRAIGLAYEAQRVDTVPTEATDQPLDAVVTESGVHHRA